MFEKLLSKGPMAMVLVYADWCGHCTQFKDKVWNDSTLSKTKNLNTAAVHYDMLDQTSLKNTPVKGYPSMFLVGKDKEAKEIPTPQNSQELLKLDNTSANALNNGNSNNVNLNSGNTNNVNLNSGNTNNGNSNNVNLNSGNTNNVNLNSGNTNSGNLNSGNTNVNMNSGNKNNGSINNSYSPLPPDALDDVVNSSETNEMETQRGGSLYDVLTRYNEEFTARQQGGRSRRKTSKRKSRRGMTRRRR